MSESLRDDYPPDPVTIRTPKPDERTIASRLTRFERVLYTVAAIYGGIVGGWLGWH